MESIKFGFSGGNAIGPPLHLWWNFSCRVLRIHPLKRSELWGSIFLKINPIYFIKFVNLRKTNVLINASLMFWIVWFVTGGKPDGLVCFLTDALSIKLLAPTMNVMYMWRIFVLNHFKSLLHWNYNFNSQNNTTPHLLFYLDQKTWLYWKQKFLVHSV